MTGATGFIGRTLVPMLQDTGYEVRVFSRASATQDDSLPVAKANWFCGELDDAERLLAACDRVEVVYHLAGIAHTSGVSLDDLLAVNTEGTRNVFTAAAKCGVARFVYLSSILAANPHSSLYAKSKLDAERLLQASVADGRGIRVSIIRPGNVYGVGMQGNLRAFIRLAIGGIIPLLPALSRKFRLVSVHDLCRVLVAQAETTGQDIERYTVTDGQAYTVHRIEEAVYQCTRKGRPLWRLPRAFLLAGALAAELVNRSGIKRNTLGMRLYKNLTGESAPEQDAAPHYEFEPADTLESEIKQIVDSLSHDPG